MEAIICDLCEMVATPNNKVYRLVLDNKCGDFRNYHVDVCERCAAKLKDAVSQILETDDVQKEYAKLNAKLIGRIFPRKL